MPDETLPPEHPDHALQPAGAPAPGWYADPTAPPGRTGRRWWTGTGWSEHVVADPAGLARTPDGAPVPSVGRRIGAYLIDGLVTGVVSTLLGLPFLIAVFRAAGDQFRRSVEAGRDGTPVPSSTSLQEAAPGAFLGLLAVSLVVLVLYHGLFLRFRSATPGKLALGLEVRPWDGPGRLSWGTVLKRLAGQFWISLLQPLPVIGPLVGTAWFLGDNLSGLGNPHRRTLHDRAAGTVVVHTRSTV